MANKVKRDKDSLQIFARVRGLMPWEPKKVSLKVVGDTVQNRAGKVINSYDFRRVFKPESTNEQAFRVIAMPMISNVLKGFNAVLIAYGQTGSGKTYSMLGKPKLGIVGILPRMLEYMVKQKQVQRVELSAVEAFGHHVAKVFLFDLYNPDNQVKDWSLKKGDTGLDMHKARIVNISDAQDAHDKIIYAHAASHFAPTGKNPESSRGHVSFIAKIHQATGGAHETQVSYFIMVDCAGSEGETAFTAEFRAAVTPQVLLCRRLEAGTINTGLSQLQVIFSELRTKGQITKTVGNGLRRVLHPFINTNTYLTVLFTLSPSVNNAKATESTLKFAVTAGMVKVKPIQTKGKVNFKSLVAELKAHIEQQEQRIDVNNTKIEALRRQQNRTVLAIEQGQNPNQGGDAGGDGKVSQTRMVKKRKEVVNDDGEIEYVDYEEEETYYVDAKNAKNNKGGVGGLVGTGPNLDHLDKEHKAAELDEDAQNALMDVLEGISKGLDHELSAEFKAMVASQRLQSDKHGIQALQTITQEDNEEAMRLALEQYAKLTAPWQKEAFIKKKKAEIAKRKNKAEDAKLRKSASQGLLMIDEQLQQAQNDYKRLQEKQKDLTKKLTDPNYAPQREMLTEHAMELNIMLANQEAVTSGLLQSKQIILEFLKEDGREALIQFFKMRVMK